MAEKDPNLTHRLNLAEGKETIRDLELKAELKEYTDKSYKDLQKVFYWTRDRLAFGIGTVLLFLLLGSWQVYEMFQHERDRITALEYIHKHDGEHE